MPNSKYELTEEQKKIIESFFLDKKFIKKSFDDIPPEPPRLAEIVSSLFGPSMASSGNTRESIAVRNYCKKNSWKYSNNTFGTKGMVILDEKQKKIIKESYDFKRPIVITRELFNNDSLNPLSREFRTVKYFINNFCKTSSNVDASSIKIKTEIPDEFIVNEKSMSGGQKKKGKKNNGENDRKGMSNGEEDNKERDNRERDNKEIILAPSFSSSDVAVAIYKYKPPKDLNQVLLRINSYLNFSWNNSNIKKHDRYCAAKLKQYLNSFRFNHQINSYKMINDRNLFEDSFIRYTYDKPDLTQEEIDQFITVCIHTVLASEIQNRVESLKVTAISQTFNIQLNDVINKLQAEYHDCIVRQQKLYATLTGERKSRLESNENNSSSVKIINLVNAWKNEEFRMKTIHLAELEKRKLEEESSKVNSWDAIHAVLRGASYEELIA